MRTTAGIARRVTARVRADFEMPRASITSSRWGVEDVIGGGEEQRDCEDREGGLILLIYSKAVRIHGAWSYSTSDDFRRTPLQAGRLDAPSTGPMSTEAAISPVLHEDCRDKGVRNRGPVWGSMLLYPFECGDFQLVGLVI